MRPSRDLRTGPDAIPVQLMTREEIYLYFQKLQSDGALAIRISNRHLELESVLGNVAQDVGLVCRGELIADTQGKLLRFWKRAEADIVSALSFFLLVTVWAMLVMQWRNGRRSRKLEGVYIATVTAGGDLNVGEVHWSLLAALVGGRTEGVT